MPKTVLLSWHYLKQSYDRSFRKKRYKNRQKSMKGMEKRSPETCFPRVTV